MYKRKVFTTIDREDNVFFPTIVARTSSVKSRELIEDFYIREYTYGKGQKAQFYTGDIYMLFNQQRLSRMELSSLTAHFNDLSPKGSALDSLRKKVSDKELSMLIKSRFIQSKSELQAYVSYLMTLEDSEREQVIALAKEKYGKEETPTETPTEVPNETPKE